MDVHVEARKHAFGGGKKHQINITWNPKQKLLLELIAWVSGPLQV
jgi:two-component sensor histidine kinase